MVASDCNVKVSSGSACCAVGCGIMIESVRGLRYNVKSFQIVSARFGLGSPVHQRLGQHHQGGDRGQESTDQGHVPHGGGLDQCAADECADGEDRKSVV